MKAVLAIQTASKTGKTPAAAREQPPDTKKASTAPPPHMQTKEWKAYVKEANVVLDQIIEARAGTYKASRETVCRLLREHSASLLPFPVVSDAQAAALLTAVDGLAESRSEKCQENAELILRSGRHLREHLNDILLEKHLGYLRGVLRRDEKQLPELISRLNGTIPQIVDINVDRLLGRVEIYRSVGSFLHPPELGLSCRKVLTRAGARARRGNLWPQDRREKMLYLEELADAGRIDPPFSEDDLLFLVSQTSMETLRRKVDLFRSKKERISPNRLKANLSRLRAGITLSNQQRRDREHRRELLRRLGASPEQIEYISARASCQTMNNLLSLSNGSLAVSDLMGGRRTIRKILRQQGRVPSDAEIALARYLIETEGVSPDVAYAYARSRKNHTLEHLRHTLQFLKDQYRRHYREHWGFEIPPEVLRRALQRGLCRSRLDKRGLSGRDYMYDLRSAVSEKEHEVIREYGPLTIQQRREALQPLREVLNYETDSSAKKQLLFIYEQFVKHGLCMAREKLKRICLRKQDLFPRPRKLQDALEILNGSYRAIGQDGEKICVSPDYIRINN